MKRTLVEWFGNGSAVQLDMNVLTREKCLHAMYFLVVIAPDCAMEGGVSPPTLYLMSRVVSYYLLSYRTDPLLENKTKPEEIVIRSNARTAYENDGF